MQRSVVIGTCCKESVTHNHDSYIRFDRGSSPVTSFASKGGRLIRRNGVALGVRLVSAPSVFTNPVVDILKYLADAFGILPPRKPQSVNVVAGLSEHRSVQSIKREI